MSLEQKTIEQIQAQVAVYASEQVNKEDSTREIDLLKSLGDISLPGLVPEYVEHPYPTMKKELTDEGLLVVTKHTGDPSPLFGKEGYLESLRAPGNRELTHTLAEMIRSYAVFEDTINKLGIADLTLEQARSHPNFLAHGGSEMVFRFDSTDEHGSTKTYVARYGQGGPERKDRIQKANDRAIAFAQAKDLPDFEQGVAVSYDPPLVISEFAEGKTLYELSMEERHAIPASHWQKLKRAIVLAASKAGLEVDGNSDNFIYNSQTGFTVIDYRSRNERKSSEETQVTNFREYHEVFEKVASSDPITKN